MRIHVTHVTPSIVENATCRSKSFTLYYEQMVLQDTCRCSKTESTPLQTHKPPPPSPPHSSQHLYPHPPTHPPTHARTHACTHTHTHTRITHAHTHTHTHTTQHSFTHNTHTQVNTLTHTSTSALRLTLTYPHHNTHSPQGRCSAISQYLVG